MQIKEKFSLKFDLSFCLFSLFLSYVCMFVSVSLCVSMPQHVCKWVDTFKELAPSLLPCGVYAWWGGEVGAVFIELRLSDLATGAINSCAILLAWVEWLLMWC